MMNVKMKKNESLTQSFAYMYVEPDMKWYLHVSVINMENGYLVNMATIKVEKHGLQHIIICVCVFSPKNNTPHYIS